MNLIAFPHYTCGGLLCDIFNNQWSQIGTNGAILNHYHSLGKIGDSRDIYDIYDVEEFNNRIDDIAEKVSDNCWISTHIWPNLIDRSKLNKILIVSTETYRSKIYRWLRCCHHYYEPSQPWIDAKQSYQVYVDKVKETAKNYLKPFKTIYDSNIVNIEFSDIVEKNPAFIKLISGSKWQQHLDRWQEINGFLYADDIWNSFYVKRFHEAEHEIMTNSCYVYQ